MSDEAAEVLGMILAGAIALLCMCGAVIVVVETCLVIGHMIGGF